MNYAEAARNPPRLMTNIEHITSVAETELRRILTRDELSSLTSKFPPEKIVSYIEKVFQEILNCYQLRLIIVWAWMYKVLASSLQKEGTEMFLLSKINSKGRELSIPW